jgi:23S rRNA pseudouridine2604 synthase
MTEAIRLSKRVAALLSCSRSEAEQYIEGGWVSVDGRVIEEPQFRVAHEQIEIDPDATLMAQLPVTLLLHQPAGQAVPRQLPGPDTHWAGDTSGQRPLRRHFSHLTPLLPLEPQASGLSVWTQDGRVVRKLTQDAHLLEIELLAEVQGETSPDTVQQLQRRARTLGAGGGAPLVKVSLNNSRAGRSTLRFAIKGGPPGLVAALCLQAGLPLLALKRMRIGRVALAQLPPGQWRYLLPHERF